MTMTLDIISDPICPWCYIGKTKLDAALAQRPGHPFDIAWRPFQLNPDMARAGMDRRAYLEAKFGGKDGAAQVYGRIEDTARAAGLDVDFARIDHTPNTIDAHRALRWAYDEGRQGALADILFDRYFRRGEDIGDADILADAAAEAGLDRALFARLLAGEADRDTVAAEDSRAREMGVQGVPTFLIGGKYVVTGAQDVETWIKIIDEISDKTEQLMDNSS
ncbi:MAG: DsbA family oxidoreductase [Pseudomonadota bacterium]